MQIQAFIMTLTGIGMMIGRFGIIIPVLAIAGNMSDKKDNSVIMRDIQNR